MAFLAKAKESLVIGITNCIMQNFERYARNKGPQN